MSDAAIPSKDGELRQATVLFADIAGFTALSQAIDPEDAADTINGCFRLIERVVLDHGGALDKFIGDCAMALFGAPRALEDAPKMAVNAAIEIRNELARFIVERRLAGRIDIHVAINSGVVVAGEVGGDLRRDYTVMGPTVNLAARLLDVATAGQIIVGPATHRYTSRDFEYRPTRPLKLKGITDTTIGYEVLTREARPYRRFSAGSAPGLVAPMVGRDRELRAIEERFTALGAGHGGIVSIVAEAGMGKSRLLAEARKLRSSAALTILEGRSLSLGRALSFHPFVDLFRSWAGIAASEDPVERARHLAAAVVDVSGDEASDLLPFVKTLMALELSADERRRVDGIAGEALEKLVRKSVYRLFERLAERGPLVLVFEDLHWMDESSLGLLEAILPLAESDTVLFLIALRPDYEATSDRILDFIDKTLAARHFRVALEPLGAADCDLLIGDLIGSGSMPQSTRALVKEKTEGNPFYIEEVLRSLLEQSALERDKTRTSPATSLAGVEIPETIEAVVMSRVDRLDDATRHVLQVAAVVGRRFQQTILEAVAPEHQDIEARLAELVSKQFVIREEARDSTGAYGETIEPGGQYVFRHALTQDAVHGALLKKTRRELHTRCAEAFEALYAERIQGVYGLLAYHWTQAEMFDKAEPYLFRAGEEAARTAASAEALHYFREAYRIYLLVHGDQANDEKKAVLEKNIGAALLNTGRLTESIEHLNAALRLHGEWVPKGGAALRMKFFVDLPIVLFHLYSGAGVRRNAERLHTHDLCAIMYDRCRAQNPTDPTRNFFDNVASMRHLMRADTTKVAHAPGMYAANGAFFAFAGLSFAVARRFLEVAETLVLPGHPVDRFQFLAMASIVDFHAGEWSGAHDIEPELLEQALRAGLLWDADTYLGFACERAVRQGRFEQARARIDDLHHLIRSYGYEFARSNHAAMSAYLLLEQRALDAARVAMHAYHTGRHEAPLRVFGLSGAARIDALDGKLDEAERELELAAEIMRQSQHLPAFYTAAYWNSRLLLDLTWTEAGDGGAARRVLRTAKRAVSVARMIARDRPEAYRLTARAHWRLGKASKARAWWTKALDEAERLGAKPERARTAADIGLLTGEDGAAPIKNLGPAEWLAAATADFESLGLDWELARIGAGGIRELRASSRG